MPALLRKLNVEPQTVAAAVKTELDRLPKAYGGAEPGLSPRLRSVTNPAEAEAERLKDDYVSTEHLLIAITTETG